MEIRGQVRWNRNLLPHQIVHEGNAVGVKKRQTTDNHRKQRHAQRPDLPISLSRSHHVGRVRVVGLVVAALGRVEVGRTGGVPHQSRVGSSEDVQRTGRFGKRSVVAVQSVENVSNAEIDDMGSWNETRRE